VGKPGGVDSRGVDKKGLEKSDRAVGEVLLPKIKERIEQNKKRKYSIKVRG